MLNIETLKPGHCITVIFSKDYAMNSGTKNTRNPLLGRVTKHAHVVGNAAGKGTYARKMNTVTNGEYIPCPTYVSPYVETDNECILALARDTSKLYLRIVNANWLRNETLLDGKPVSECKETFPVAGLLMTAKEVIAHYKKAKSPKPDVGFETYHIEHCTNASL
jgi:hypothetical protein